MRATPLFIALAVLMHGTSTLAFTLRQLHRLETLAMHHADPADPAARVYTQQTLDHFNAADNRTWSQRYFVNDTFYSATEHTAVFLQLGGEGGIGSDYVEAFQYVEYARQHDALIVALEHRFYGASLPLPDLSTDNLAYLSSMQALEDAVQFTNWLKTTYPGLTEDTPVFVFGCSYSGALVSWARQKYPFVFQGAVAGSAPVLATLDFYAYLETVEVSLSTLVGERCVEQVQNATDQIQTLLQSGEGQAKVQSMFKTCTAPNNTLDTATLMQNLMGNWMGVVQYNNERAGAPSVSSLCATMNNYTDPLEAYVAISDDFLKGEGAACMDISYAIQVQMLKNVSAPPSGVGARAWTYQTCTAFGYFQTTDAPSGTQPFGDLVPLSYSLQLCEDVFGLGIDVGAAINATNARYGGHSPDTTRVVYIDGTIDPWRPLTVLAAPNEDSPVISIVGTAHCATSFPVSPIDPPGVAPAFKQVSMLLGDWINNPE